MGTMKPRRRQCIVLIALGALAATACGDGDEPAVFQPASLPTAEVDDAPGSGSQLGDEIGFGSVGPPIESPEPWPTLTIYSGFEPGILGVDFSPPDPTCVAAQASATVGRGGAILVRLWVENTGPVAEPCPGSADVAQVRIVLTEPIGDRHIYNHVGSEEIERMADEIIGMDAAEAIEMIRDAGFDMRDNTGQEAVDSDFDANRINIETEDGVVEFARVG